MLFEEAEKRGLTASQKEIMNYKNEVQSLLKQDEASEIRLIIDMMIEAFELTEEEYWSQATDTYKKMLSILKLKEQVGEKELPSLYEQLREKANIEYYLD